ncbi:MAG: hypothetical protein ACE5GA_10805 [Candidatus Zixiibacteriota bacterium]
MPEENSPFSDLGNELFPGGTSDSTGNSMFIVFSYVPILCLLPILRMGQDEGLRFHARQGLVLFLIEIVAAIFLIPALSSLIWKAILIACIGSSIAGAVFALQGRQIRLPIIGDLADKIKI